MKEQWWKVEEGTGMGMTMSGAIADAALYKLIEMNWIKSEKVRAKFGIIHYSRFKDDILVVMLPNWTDVKQFIAEIKTRAKYFKIEVEKCSTQKVQMLDLELAFGPHFVRTGKLDFWPFFKDASKTQRPLSQWSKHPSTMHLNWPLRNLERLSQRCSSQEYFNEAKNTFVQRMESFGAMHCVLQKLKSFDPFLLQRQGGQMYRPSVPDETKSHTTIWLVLPYSFVWKSANLCKLIQEYMDDPASRHLVCSVWGFDPKLSIKIAWKLVQAPLTSLVGM